MNNERKIIDSVETLESALASLKEAEKKFSTYTQEQVDKIFLAAASCPSDQHLQYLHAVPFVPVKHLPAVGG